MSQVSISYSLHLSSKKHAISSAQTLGRVSKHNLRDYEKLKEGYDRDQISILIGSGSILEDVKSVYHEEFDKVLEEYNENQKPYRQIEDYFQHVSDSRSDVAAEMIIQVGAHKFWKEHEVDQVKMDEVMKAQIKLLQEQMPGFKIASAVVHYDESSPHMHIVGVPVAEGYTHGLQKQVAKTKVFTRDSLKNLQEIMHDAIQKQLDELYPEIEAEIKRSEKGLNHDMDKKQYIEYSNAKAAVEAEMDKAEAQKAENDRLEALGKEKREYINSLDEQSRIKNKNLGHLKKQEAEIKERVEKLEEKENNLEEDIETGLEPLRDKVYEGLAESYENVDRYAFEGIEIAFGLPEGKIVETMKKSIEDTMSLCRSHKRLGIDLDFNDELARITRQNFSKLNKQKTRTREQGLFQRDEMEL
ncbi:plasmid recombination protein [Clostridium beijerinckii]|uniref:plasmid recombination protein n=1 Tax=Clostridium beijerinckii TaxID=1520 RepID=UPI000685A092|nr:plasmid recombination protein [Clostridium beijerinckii]